MMNLNLLEVMIAPSCVLGVGGSSFGADNDSVTLAVANRFY